MYERNMYMEYVYGIKEYDNRDTIRNCLDNCPLSQRRSKRETG